jgi:hypothetical protein
VVAGRMNAEPGAVMTLSATALFCLSAVFGSNRGLVQSLPGRAHLEG